LIEYDNKGNVVSVKKIPSGDLPKLHRIRSDVRIDDAPYLSREEPIGIRKIQTKVGKSHNRQIRNISASKKMSERIIDNIGK
jgi:hypothetical protein